MRRMALLRLMMHVTNDPYAFNSVHDILSSGPGAGPWQGWRY